MAKSQEREDAIYLEYRQGTSDKVYHVYLRQHRNGWTVVTEYGRRGSQLVPGKQGAPFPSTWTTAKEQFDRIVREKMAKGYVESGDVRRVMQQAAAETEQRRQALSWLLKGDA